LSPPPLSELPPHAVTVRPSAATRAVAARSLLEVLEVRIPVPSQGWGSLQEVNSACALIQAVI
jgi:hypothetical protein